jgi:hypothetical protein
MDFLKYAQIGVFGLKSNHLATLIATERVGLAKTFITINNSQICRFLFDKSKLYFLELLKAVECDPSK